MPRIQHWQALGYTHPDEQIEIARVAEEVGFTGLLLSDHVFVPVEQKSKYPYSARAIPTSGATRRFRTPS
jgi:alkanesulfonate monooxygenase SsuD/methylene tetrahydromethanopterin reductase-like flavin-dependent oxidoreductase (luciferase family)